MNSFDEYLNYNSYFKLLGESENVIFLLYSAYYREESEIIAYDLSDQKIKKSVSLETTNENIYRVKYLNNNIIITKHDGIYYYSKELELIERIEIPKYIKEKIALGRTKNDLGLLQTCFTGFDISNDQEYLVYGDQEGVKLYNLITEQEKLIIKSTEVNERPDYIVSIIYWSPYFVGDNNIVTTEAGYESFGGFVYYNFKDDELKTFDFRSDVMYLNEIFQGQMVSMLAVYFDVSEEHPDGSGSIMLDLNSGDFYFIGDSVNWHLGYMVPHTYAYNGKHSAAFVEPLANDTLQKRIIHKYNYETKDLEDKVLKIINAEVEIIGVLDNNSVLIKYYRDESDVGVVLMN